MSGRTVTLNLDRVRGCIWGQALGDALGLPYESMSRRRVQEVLGDGPLYCFSPTVRRAGSSSSTPNDVTWPPGSTSDDTQQFLALLRAYSKWDGEWDTLGRVLGPEFLRAYTADPAGAGSHTRAVFAHPLFYSAPMVAAQEVWSKGGGVAAGNGAVMRSAASGLWFPWDPLATLTLAEWSAQATHPHPDCKDGSTLTAITVSAFVAGVDFEPQPRPSLLETLETLGEQPIGYTKKTLAIGQAVIGNTKLSVLEILEQVIRAGGDTDTNAAVAGAVLGAERGFSCLPAMVVDLRCTPLLREAYDLVLQHYLRQPGAKLVDGNVVFQVST